MKIDRNGKLIRVCFVSPKAYPLFNEAVDGVFGGAEVDLYYLATELAKDEGFDVSFIVADYGQADVETIENVTVIKSLDFGKSALNGAWQIWRALQQGNADIYMLETASPGVPLVAWFCKLKGKAFVYRTASKLECNGIYIKQNFFLGKACIGENMIWQASSPMTLGPWKIFAGCPLLKKRT